MNKKEYIKICKSMIEICNILESDIKDKDKIHEYIERLKFYAEKIKRQNVG